MNIVLVGAGRAEPLPFLRQKLENADKTIAVDGGLQAFAALELCPDLIVGDFDSVTLSVVKKFPHAEQLSLPVHKDQSDMEVAVEQALSHQPQKIEILQAFGKRMDHFFANCYLTFLRPGRIFLESPKETFFALEEKRINHLKNKIDTIVSLLPFTAEVQKVTTHDLAYPLVNETLHQNSRPLSNVVCGERPSVEFSAGKLAAYILYNMHFT